MPAKLTQAEVKKRLARKHLKPLGPYDSQKPCRLRCTKCHVEYLPTPTAWHQIICGQVGCRGCAGGSRRALTQKEAAHRYRKLGIRLLSSYVNANTPVDLECLVCEHRWQSDPHANLHQGNGCPSCANNTIADKKRTPESEVRDRLLEQKIEIVGTYSGVKYPVALRCLACGYQWEARCYDILVERSDGCPWCTGYVRKKYGSRPEIDARRIVERLTGWKFPKAKPDWLRGYNSHALELDGYNKRHNVAFEFQGIHHYRPIFGEERLHKCKLDDDRKRKLCQRHGVFLIRIPYFKRDVEDFIRTKLAQAGILPTPRQPA